MVQCEKEGIARLSQAPMARKGLTKGMLMKSCHGEGDSKQSRAWTGSFRLTHLRSIKNSASFRRFAHLLKPVGCPWLKNVVIRGNRTTRSRIPRRS